MHIQLPHTAYTPVLQVLALLPPNQRFIQWKYLVYGSNHIHHTETAGIAGRQKRLHSTLISKGIEPTFQSEKYFQMKGLVSFRAVKRRERETSG